MEDTVKTEKPPPLSQEEVTDLAQRMLNICTHYGSDGIIAVLDAAATVHATILMRWYEHEDWTALMKSYHNNVAEKIIAVGDALAKEISRQDGQHNNMQH